MTAKLLMLNTMLNLTVVIVTWESAAKEKAFWAKAVILRSSTLQRRKWLKQVEFSSAFIWTNA